MAENQTDKQAVKETAAAVEPNKKKLRIGFAFLALVPLAVFLMIQTVSQVPFIIMAAAEVMNGGAATGLSETFDFYESLMLVFNEKYSLYAYLIYAVIGLVVFGFWYYKGFVKNSPKVKFGQVFGVKSVLASIGIVAGFYFSINAVLTLLMQLLPDLMESYNQLLEMAGIGSNTLVTIIYAIILGPILEELVFRGVIYSYLEKAGLRPIVVILITGILFGFVHMNIVQSTYAAILGILLGFLRYKYRSIKLTIFAHILLNFSGTYGEMALHKLGLSDSIYIILGGIGLFVIVFSAVLVNSDKKAFKASNEGQEQLN